MIVLFENIGQNSKNGKLVIPHVPILPIPKYLELFKYAHIRNINAGRENYAFFFVRWPQKKSYLNHNAPFESRKCSGLLPADIPINFVLRIKIGYGFVASEFTVVRKLYLPKKYKLATR